MMQELPLAAGLLALAICAVWLPALRLSNTITIPLWLVLFLAAILTGLSAGYLKPVGALALLITTASLYYIDRAPSKLARGLSIGFATVLVLLLAFHAVPGFQNPILLNKIRFTPDALPYTMYANFDKASVGLLLLALVCPHAKTWHDWRQLLRQSLPIIVATIVAVTIIGLALGYVRIAPKWPASTALWVVVNLLFVSVAEESFFRGFLQARLARLLTTKNVAAAQGISLVVCAILFGLVHFGGGVMYIALATLASLGYGYAYLRTQRVEAAIITHFAVNLVHFLGLTYPALAKL